MAMCRHGVGPWGCKVGYRSWGGTVGPVHRPAQWIRGACKEGLGEDLSLRVWEARVMVGGGGQGQGVRPISQGGGGGGR